MPSQTLRPHAGRPEPGKDGTPIPPATYSAQELDCGGNPAGVLPYAADQVQDTRLANL